MYNVGKYGFFCTRVANFNFWGQEKKEGDIYTYLFSVISHYNSYIFIYIKWLQYQVHSQIVSFQFVVIMNLKLY